MKKILLNCLFIILITQINYAEQIDLETEATQILNNEKLNSDQWVDTVQKLRTHLYENQNIKESWFEILKNFSENDKKKVEFSHLCAQIGFCFPLEVCQITGIEFSPLENEEQQSKISKLSDTEINKAKKNPNFFGKLFKAHFNVNILSNELTISTKIGVGSNEEFYLTGTNENSKYNKAITYCEDLSFSFLQNGQSISIPLHLTSDQEKLLFIPVLFSKTEAKHIRARAILNLIRGEVSYHIKKDTQNALRYYDEVLNTLMPHINQKDDICLQLARIRKAEIFCNLGRKTARKIRDPNECDGYVQKALDLIKSVKSPLIFQGEHPFLLLYKAKIKMGIYGEKFANLTEAQEILLELHKNIPHLLALSCVYLGELYGSFHGECVWIPKDHSKAASYFYFKKGTEQGNITAAIHFSTLVLSNPDAPLADFKLITDYYKSICSYAALAELYAQKSKFQNKAFAEIFLISNVLEHGLETNVLELAEQYLYKGYIRDAVVLLSQSIKLKYSHQSNFVLGNILTSPIYPETYDLTEGIFHYKKLVEAQLFNLARRKISTLVKKNDNIEDLKIIFSIYEDKFPRNIKSTSKSRKKSKSPEDPISKSMKEHFKNEILPLIVQKYSQNQEIEYRRLLESLCKKMGLPLPHDLFVDKEAENTETSTSESPQNLNNEDTSEEDIEIEDENNDEDNEEYLFSDPIEPEPFDPVFIHHKIYEIMVLLRYSEELTFKQMLELTEWLGGRTVTAAKDQTKITFFLPNKEPFKMHKFHTGNMKDAAIKVSKAGYIKKWKRLVREILEERGIWEQI